MSNVFGRVLGHDLPVVDRGKGTLIWDAAGKEYIDAAGGAIVVGIGHGDSEVIDALADQARKISFAHGTQFTSEPLEAYAAELAPLLPVDDPRIYPVSGGSEAVETALKMARAYHVARGQRSRHKVIARLGSYHGNTLGALDASGRGSLRSPYLPWIGRTRHVPAAYEYRCPLDSHAIDCGERHAEILDETIRGTGPESVACFIAEPVVGAALGAVVPPSDYWGAVQRVCNNHGVLLITDEVMTGFGRTGTMFACEHWGAQPDILVAGKGASSGYWPFGFAACSGRVYDTISETGFTHGFTHSHSVLGATVARTVLRRLREQDLPSASREKGKALRTTLREALASHPYVGDVRGLGLMIGIELVADRDTKTPFPREKKVTERLLAQAKDRGLLLYPSTGGADGTNGDVIMLGPPFVITDDQLESTCALLTVILFENSDELRRIS